MAIVSLLLDKAKSHTGIASDNALATRLGLSRQAISNWRAGEKFPDEDTVVTLAKLAGEDAAEWLVALKAVKSNGPAAKVWSALAKKLAGTTAVLCLVAASLYSRDWDGLQAAVLFGFYPIGPLYIMRNYR